MEKVKGAGLGRKHVNVAAGYDLLPAIPLCPYALNYR